mmetsp:Transcript_9639/g.14867  ORF Transcript_9639/g.14867 Transcript_9639/m.14867 type:complete len:174 (+) Transcript_9639:167-688(+)
MLSAFLLSLASSTDNFAVGLTVGLSKKPLSAVTNGIISFCNALGATFAAWGGGHMAGSSYLSIIASLAFFYLAYQEFNGDDEEKDEKEGKKQPDEVSMIMAIPMTLNNLVGGVAGGAVGISPLMAGFSALLASYCTMSLGYWVGRRATSNVLIQPSHVSSILFAVLGILSLLS